MSPSFPLPSVCKHVKDNQSKRNTVWSVRDTKGEWLTWTCRLEILTLQCQCIWWWKKWPVFIRWVALSDVCIITGNIFKADCMERIRPWGWSCFGTTPYQTRPSLNLYLCIKRHNRDFEFSEWIAFFSLKCVICLTLRLNVKMFKSYHPMKHNWI